MGKIIVCKTKTADDPYIFLNTKVSVYSYEELCYYIYNNMVLIGRDDVTERLAMWIRKELDMPELAGRLESLMEKEAFTQDILIEIITAGNYYGTDEIRAFMKECQKIRGYSKYELLKVKADGYCRYKHYIKAGAMYDEIIKNFPESQGTEVFLGNVYHNKAVVLSGNLQREEARQCFLKAYKLNHNEESLIEYLYVTAVTVDSATLKREIKRHGMPESFFDDVMMEIADCKDDVAEMSIYNKVQKAVYNKLHGNISDYDRRVDSVLTELKDDFRKQLA